MTTLTIDGEFTIYTAAELKPRLLDWLKAGDATEIDLSGVSEIDGAGLQLLILARRESERAGTNLQLGLLSDPVRDVLKLTGLAHFAAAEGES